MLLVRCMIAYVSYVVVSCLSNLCGPLFIMTIEAWIGCLFVVLANIWLLNNSTEIIVYSGDRKSVV